MTSCIMLSMMKALRASMTRKDSSPARAGWASAITAGSKYREGAGHLKRRGRARTERHGEVGRVAIGIEAESGDVILRVLRADRLQDANRHHVLRLGERHAHAHGPFVPAVVVLRFPYLPARQGRVDHHGSVVDHGGRRKALLQRGRIDERLETRAGLAPGLGHVVVLAPVEIEAADERAHGAVLRVGRDKGALGLRELDDLPIATLVFLDANHPAAPDPAGRWG